MERINGPFKAKLWTSSHGMRHRHLPQAFERFFFENEIISEFTINAKSGRKFDHHFMQDYTVDFTVIKDSRAPRISVILMGDNDLRQNAIRGASRILDNTEELIKMHKGTCHPLLMLGLMPSPATYPQTGLPSVFVDEKVNNEIAKQYGTPEGRMFAFASTKAFFTDAEGNLYTQDFFVRDGVHLSPHGANTLARNIISTTFDLATLILESQK